MSTQPTTQQDPYADPKPGSLAAWKKAAYHTVVGPSGFVFGVKIPDLAQLIKAGQIPQHLLDTALEVAGANGGTGEEVPPVTRERIEEQVEFTHKLIELTVVEPKVTEADAEQIPAEDKEFIVAVAMRMREWDAVGNHITGLDKSEKFRSFRRIGEFAPDVEGL